LVKVTFRPWEEVVIHESIQYSLDNLVTMRSLGLLWAEGVAFSHAAMPPTEDIIKEMLKGHVHWNSVEWALMPEFKTFIEIPQTKVRIPVLNVSTNETLSDVASALKRTAQQI